MERLQDGQLAGKSVSSDLIEVLQRLRAAPTAASYVACSRNYFNPTTSSCCVRCWSAKVGTSSAAAIVRDVPCRHHSSYPHCPSALGAAGQRPLLSRLQKFARAHQWMLDRVFTCLARCRPQPRAPARHTPPQPFSPTALRIRSAFGVYLGHHCTL
jgi:hypothetical protein